MIDKDPGRVRPCPVIVTSPADGAVHVDAPEDAAGSVMEERGVPGPPRPGHVPAGTSGLPQ
jgi:hypothetical protein